MNGTRITIAGVEDERTTVEAVREDVPRGSRPQLWAVEAPALPSYPYTVRRSLRTNLRRSSRKLARRARLANVFGPLPLIGAPFLRASAFAWLEWRIAVHALEACRRADHG